LVKSDNKKEQPSISETFKGFFTNPERPRPLASSLHVDSKLILSSLFEGVVLTEKVMSICKAKEAIKFRCHNGHVFYKYVDSLKAQIKNALGRKLSASTAASSTSSDEEVQDAAHLYGCWCPKCEEFFTACKKIARDAGFKLEGKLYSKTLSFRCPDRKHITPISINKRVS
jgi:hypothetical protein